MIEAHSASSSTILELPPKRLDQQGMVFHRPLELRPGPKLALPEKTESHQSNEGGYVEEPMEYGQLDKGIYARARYEDGM